MTDILREIGCRCVKTGSRLVIDAVFVDRTEVPGKYVKAMRSSIILLGALLGRMKEGRCSFPGGCLIGADSYEEAEHIVMLLNSEEL